ncbi:hypothetical protein AXF42_Ash010842 [Apostasia shenzhenica]|uniref:Uncharacterized protein n=1 Tax=Apostasia shenzhenica TaxID=1088818 RepID=A0A2I0A0U0_9ASPA|nr:hypothetical protein AXF42_Ash010842 [Apostasia shenzhenica]
MEFSVVRFRVVLVLLVLLISFSDVSTGLREIKVQAAKRQMWPNQNVAILQKKPTMMPCDPEKCLDNCLRSTTADSRYYCNGTCDSAKGCVCQEWCT